MIGKVAEDLRKRAIRRVEAFGSRVAAQASGRQCYRQADKHAAIPGCCLPALHSSFTTESHIEKDSPFVRKMPLCKKGGGNT